MRLWTAVVALIGRIFRKKPAATPILLLPAPKRRRALRTPDIIYLPYHAPKQATLSFHQAYSGAFYFRDAILDQLDDYIFYLKRMRRSDPQAYALYSKIGAGIYPIYDPTHQIFAARTGALSPWFTKTLPSFGAVATGISAIREREEDSKKLLYPRFMWFTKYSRPAPTIERSNRGTTYACTVYWDKKTNPKFRYGVPQEFPVVVTQDGTVQLLRSLYTDHQIIRHKSGSDSLVRHQRWGIWPGYHDWARQNKIDTRTLLTNVFFHAANAFEAVNTSMIRVAASKDGVTAVFGVDITRTPYFFADREEMVTQDGRKQRIFHVVRAHLRSGRGVRLHFRGLRRFRWKGYDISITVPGRDHPDLAEFDVSAIDEHWEHEYRRGSLIGVDQLGGRLAAMINAGPKHEAQMRALLD